MTRDGAVSHTISVWSSDELAYLNLRIQVALGHFRAKSNRFRVGPTVSGLVVSHTISVWLSDEFALLNPTVSGLVVDRIRDRAAL